MTLNPPKRILVVDDDAEMAELLRLALPEYEVGLVPDAESALTMAMAFQPALFILDLVLPGMRGTSLALLLRETDDFAATPIFLLSGLIEPRTADGEPVRIQGLTAFSKPFNLAVLRKHVELHVEDAPAGQLALAKLQPGRIAGE